MKFLSSFCLICTLHFNLFAQTELTKADSLINYGAYEEALSLYESYLQKHPDKIEIWIKKAGIDIDAFNYVDALADYTEGIKYNPNSAELFYYRGILNGQLHHTKEALEDFDSATKIKNEGVYYFCKAMVYQELEDTLNAQKNYRTALQKNYKTAEVYTFYAKVLTDMDSINSALSIINEGIKLYNDFPYAYFVRAIVKTTLFDINGACADFDKSYELGHKELSPVPPEICNGTPIQQLKYCGGVLTQFKKYSRAVTAYTKVIKSEPDSSDNYLFRGFCYYKLRQYPKAEKDYFKALSLPINHQEMLYDNLVTLYYDNQQYDKALEYSSKKIDLDKTNYNAYLERGIIYMKAKNYAKAESDFTQTLVLMPDFYNALAHRASLYYEQGIYNKAYDDAQKSVMVNPNFGDGYLLLARIKLKLKMPDYCDDFETAKKLGNKEAEKEIDQYCK